MTVENVACNQCGAPLAVPDAAKFVTCKHCGANLAIRRNESVTYTEQIAKIARSTSNLAHEVARLKYESELARIERAWQKEREQHIVKSQYGEHEPNEFSAIMLWVLVCGGGLMLGAVSVGAGVPAGLLFGVLIAAAGVALGHREYSKFKKYEAAQHAYAVRRGTVRVEDFLPDDDEIVAARGDHSSLSDEDLVRILTEKSG